MTTLTVRNVDIGLESRLRARAARNGRSMEAELRQILNDTLATESDHPGDLADAIRRRFSPFGGVEIEAHPPVTMPEPPLFE